MTRSITPADLKPGDVLLFEGMRSDAISSAIMFLTDSSVSHAAMVYDGEGDGKPATLVHEASPKVPVSVREAAASFGDRLITVRRLPEPPRRDKTPLIRAADHYLLEQAPYNNHGLYLVGVMLIYQRFSPDRPTSRIVARILRLAASLLTHYLNTKKFPGQHPMTCSQFVAQCYDDAGDDYRLFAAGLLDAANAPGAPSLLEQTIDVMNADRDFDDKLAAVPVGGAANESEAAIVASADELSGQLLESLENMQAIDTAEFGLTPIDDELALAVNDFAESVYALYHGSDDNDMAAPTAATATSKLEWLKEQRNLFVSPADLLSNNHLETVGTIKLK